MSVNILQTSADLTNAFEVYNKFLFKYAYVRLQNRELAEDITQEVFFKAWNKRNSFNPQKSSLKNWLFVIATNTIRDYYRTKKNEALELEDNLQSTADIAKETEQEDLIQFVFHHIQQLSEREQELLNLRYVQGFSAKEVAKMMGMQYSATKVAFHRAIQKLQKLCNESKM